MSLRLTDYAEIASLIRTMVVHHPEHLLRTTPTGPWALLRIGPSDTLACNLPGCLAVIATREPSFIPEGTEIDSGTLARALASELPLKRFSDSLLVQVTLQGDVWRSCCLIDGKDIPWVENQVQIEPDADSSFAIPPPDERPAQRETSLFAMPYLGGTPATSLAGFLEVVGDDPDAPYILPGERDQRRHTWMMRNLRAERARLNILGLACPPWLDEALGGGLPRPAALTPPQPAPRARRI